MFILSILLLVSGIHAQDIKFMVGGSLSRYVISPEIYFNWIASDEYSYEISYKAGFMIGGGIEFSLDSNVSLEIDALYLQIGTKAQRFYSHLEIYVVPQKYTLHVINIPVLLKIRFRRVSSPYILGGYEWSLVLSHRCKPFFDGQTGDISITESTETPVGFVFGGGYEIKVKAISFLIEGRYHYGLSNIIRGPQTDWETAKTRTITLSAGFKI